MSGYTSVVVVTTEEHPWENKGNSLSEIANRVEDRWNAEIDNGDNEFTMRATVDDYKVDINDRTDAETAKNEAAGYLENSNISMVYDVVLVMDDYSHDAANGYAFVGSENNPAAGTYDRGIAYCTKGDYHLAEHEVSHTYGGLHDHHDEWGSYHYTIMGNPGDKQCFEDNTTSSFRVRNNQYNNCAQQNIRSYVNEHRDKLNY
ncbi:hypothetical protein [Halostella salina]|uniref:hypothetical protein n=1 Tax=Halostella salina TaxID=1547897 RepID=UPI0013CF11BB|nr:hypothetical protein [Halostella salina]